jgi:hypothetical protein
MGANSVQSGTLNEPLGLKKKAIVFCGSGITTSPAISMA